MSCNKWGLMLACALLVMGVTASQANAAIEAVWDGGNGEWDDSKWNGGQFIFDVVGIWDGSNGYKGPLNAENEQETITIGKGATVNYDADTIGGGGSDLRIKQGGNLIIREGATFQHLSDDSWQENRWTEMDPSNLIMDNGTFRRTGAVREEGGGALMFGSWRGDDNFDVSPLDHQETLIQVINGGRFLNEGQVWFGSWEDMPQFGTVIKMTINDGTVDFTGGEIVADGNAPANGDLAFFNKFSAELNPDDQPTFAINFTGPGTLTVDSAGIINAYVDENSEWQNLDPVSYQDLWEAGILQADGLSGPDGANFGTYFTVTGTVGADNYKLTRVTGTMVGDYNNNKALDAGDLDLQAGAMVAGGPKDPFDLNKDNAVDFADRKMWLHDLKKTWVGDADLDGLFDSADFVLAFQAGKYEVAGATATWGQGDWGGDQLFTSADFVAAFADGGYEIGPRPAAVSAVPEPGSVVLALVGLLGLAGLSRRRAA